MRKRRKAKRNLQLWYLIGGAILLAACVLVIVLLTGSPEGETSNGTDPHNENAAQSTQNKPESQKGTATEPTIQHEDGSTHPTEGTEPVYDFSVRGALYWNVDRAKYTDGNARKPDENGNFKIRFAHDGTLLETTVADRELVAFIDTMDVMGLTFGENNVIIEALDPNDVALEFSKNVFVKTVSADSLTISSTADLNGYMVTYDLGENAGIYDVTPDAQNPGSAMQPTQLKAGDTLVIFGDGEGNVTHIFVVAHTK